MKNLEKLDLRGNPCRFPRKFWGTVKTMEVVVICEPFSILTSPPATQRCPS